MKHFIVTRFNVAWCHQYHGIRLDDDWLRGRVALFERYTLPSVRLQTFADFRWRVLIDDESPDWLIERLSLCGCLKVVKMPAKSYWVKISESLCDDDWSTVTRLDSDDMLATDFMERLHDESGKRRSFLQFLHGAVLATDGRLYERTISNSNFATEIVPPGGEVNLYRIDHSRIGQAVHADVIGGPIAWCNVIHGCNLVNYDGMATGCEIRNTVIAKQLPLMELRCVSTD